MCARLFVLDGKPILHSASYLPVSIVGHPVQVLHGTGLGGTYAGLVDLGHAPVRFRDDVRARVPDPHEIKALDLPTGGAIIEIVRTAFTAEDRPVEAIVMTLDASAYVVRYDFSA